MAKGSGGTRGGGGGSNSQGRFFGTDGVDYYGGPGSRGWKAQVKNALSKGMVGMKNDVYIFGDLDKGASYTILAGVAAKSTGFQKDIATKGLQNLHKTFNKGTGLTEKQSWAVVYEFKKIFGK
jgi:hypothetical protein